MTASLKEEVADMRASLVVVRALPAVVSQVKRRLLGVALGILGVGAVRVVLGRAPLGVHLVHRTFLRHGGVRRPLGEKRRTPRRGGLLRSGLAAAVDGYEHAP